MWGGGGTCPDNASRLTATSQCRGGIHKGILSIQKSRLTRRDTWTIQKRGGNNCEKALTVMEDGSTEN